MGRDPVRRAFYQWSGGTGQDHEALSWFSTAGPEQMGPLRTSFRGGIAPWAWAKAMGLLVVICVVLSVLVAVLRPEGADPATIVGVWAVTSTIYLLIMLGAWVAARSHRHDVHAHGLVVTAPWGGPEAIPWATIDPGRTFVARSVRSMTRMPLALYRQRAVFAPGLVINGWTDRPRGSHEVFEAFSSGYRYQPTPSDSPFGWWQLGVTDPGALLTAIESAMVADGYPAAGLTPFALSRSFTAADLRRDPVLQRERALTDPPIGLP